MGSSAMSKKTIVAILLIAGLPAAGLSSSVLASQERPGGSPGFQDEGQSQQASGLDEGEVLEDFINIVWLISTKRERDAWGSAVTDEQKAAFVAEFWEKRDPTPGTEVNEFRDLYMRRVAAANRKFGNEDLPGYRTDRGQFILIYSEDAILEQERRRLSVDPEAVNPPGGSEGDRRFRIIWSIDPAINPYLEGIEQVVFEQSQKGYSRTGRRLTLDQDALLAHRDLQALFALLLAGSRTVTPAVTGATVAGNEGAGSGGENPATARLSAAGEAMRQLIDEGVSRQEIGLRFETAYFPAPENNTYMVVAFKLDKQALTFADVAGVGGSEVAAGEAAVAGAGEAGEVGEVEAVGVGEQEGEAEVADVPLPPAPVHAFGFLLQESPAGPEQLLRQMAMEFLVDPVEGTESASRTYSFGMTMVPGSYRLAWGVIDDISERLTTLSTPIEVPNFGTGQLTLTSVLVARPPMREQTESIDIDKVYEGVRIGNIQLDVDIDRHFQRDDTIELLYFVMGASIDPTSQQPQLEVEHTLLHGDSDEIIARLPTQTLNYFAIGQQIPLAQVVQIEPGGSYRILIRVKDVVSENELTYEVPFTLAGEGPAQ